MLSQANVFLEGINPQKLERLCRMYCLVLCAGAMLLCTSSVRSPS